MKTPTEYDIERLMHVYDPAKAHEYYLRVRKLKGREKRAQDPETIRGRRERHKEAKALQREKLTESIKVLEAKLVKLEALVKKRTHEEASENRKSKAKKERAAKEKDKPKTAAEKAKAARGNEKYRKKNQQKLKTKAKSDKSGGGSSKGKADASKHKKHSAAELKTLATKVRGQIQVAKKKLTAL